MALENSIKRPCHQAYYEVLHEMHLLDHPPNFLFLPSVMIRGHRGRVPLDVPFYTQHCFRSRKRGASATGEQCGEGILRFHHQGMIEANDHIN
jgi:hypothetical protein